MTFFVIPITTKTGRKSSFGHFRIRLAWYGTRAYALGRGLPDFG